MSVQRLGDDSPDLFHMTRLGDTHAKVLVCDSHFSIITSFNWLSFRGDEQLEFRDERGYYVGLPEKSTRSSTATASALLRSPTSQARHGPASERRRPPIGAATPPLRVATKKWRKRSVPLPERCGTSRPRSSPAR